ncbi:5-methyltetrahydropteroyltriglutamate--homocysteine S-methyltransferase [Methylovorus sp. MM2]|uniref:5-methyltetrahydropteroyltriglutamate-- homocysteine S-methyltransferase n=1 Tax=Methylovorus sp. MM2 TaxID=1848038 RepID=UPI0007DF4063|nr:5-methyltetrahydropteroyltriglutamate--homocysteine S-methyltransferase [Methylovorus sp. MM2]OAM53188.1 5-methyltetrahydropteroyltriglutamate--homocysteine S-methyltransferase [Methylovorus sp. MM2]
MTTAHILGYPRIGAKRELKFALESFWQGNSSIQELEATGSQLRHLNWQKQESAGLAFVSVGDFSYYDHVLDHTVLFGAAPARFGLAGKVLAPTDYFSLARGNASQPASEMTKWFDTNYHYLVPELGPETAFSANAHELLVQVDEALATGSSVKPTLLGPVSYLYLSKSRAEGFDRVSLLPSLCAQYAALLAELKYRGIEWVQIDEPILTLDLNAQWLEAFEHAYARIRDDRPKLLLATYFDHVARYIPSIISLPVDGIHIDLVRAPEQLKPWLHALPSHWVLSAGVVDGRNIWRNNLNETLDILEPVSALLGDRLWIAPSCSLLHVPVTLDHETKLDSEIKSWLAFADEKLIELQVLVKALDEGRDAVSDALSQSYHAAVTRSTSSRVHASEVSKRLEKLHEVDADRQSPFAARRVIQQAELKLPLLPTTTIGSFPQTAEIRASRAAFKRGELNEVQYISDMQANIRHAIKQQEFLGLDVLVHGEAERNDMVEYFGEQLAGYAFTQNGWVQSYGSRCVKPPVIYGDVYRPLPMTVEATTYAQSLTQKPVKGMLTGPVTMLQWSFVRNDQLRETTALQLALAIRDEVADLEKAGISVIQIDEPAFREGLPLQKANWAHYLAWAVRAFKLSASVANDATQIHTHMCYSEFNDILPSIAAMDADVITIETSRSAMELLDGFGEFEYPNEIGPGVYDIHSPRVPTVEAMEKLMLRAMEVIPVERLWINPDCGLKTRAWPETVTALQNMVQVARNLRASLQQ